MERSIEVKDNENVEIIQKDGKTVIKITSKEEQKTQKMRDVLLKDCYIRVSSYRSDHCGMGSSDESDTSYVVVTSDNLNKDKEMTRRRDYDYNCGRDYRSIGTRYDKLSFDVYEGQKIYVLISYQYNGQDETTTAVGFYDRPIPVNFPDTKYNSRTLKEYKVNSRQLKNDETEMYLEEVKK